MLPFNLTTDAGSDRMIWNTLLLLIIPGTVTYFLLHVEVGYICWYRLSEHLNTQPMAIATMALPAKSAIRLHPLPEFSVLIFEPVKSTPLFSVTDPKTW